MKDLLIALAQSLVEKPDEVKVEEQVAEDGSVVFYLRVAEGDMGRVIGKQGRIAKAIRTLLRAAATREDKKVSVEIVD
ncbi:MAG: KH domain-containing protein [Clostridia bacterium]|nr:KH domain-containing protein [Clostridia bacterium]MBR4439193.1 KH domain-containing protein [Clostridia bacterium]MBR5769424.1 KH domain-containing protein [Clostridia bacterium]MBR5943113.1 KH domain-containing protein [Clostridia bacterium]